MKNYRDSSEYSRNYGKCRGCFNSEALVIVFFLGVASMNLITIVIDEILPIDCVEHNT